MIKSKKRKKEDFSKFVVIGIIFLVLLFYMSTFTSSNMQEKTKTPTGNIDIFDVIIKEQVCQKCENNSNVNPNNGDTSNNDDSFVDDGKLTVYDKIREYGTETPLRIFENPAYELENIIAPGATNIYQFVIRNANDFNIKYSVVVDEYNPYGINMRFRLLYKGEYIVGSKSEWVSADKLELIEKYLEKKTLIPYSLEWQWFDGNNDSAIGENSNSSYKLKINIFAEEII